MTIAWLANFLAIGFLVFLAVVVFRQAMRGAVARKHIAEAVRVLLVMIAMALAAFSGRGAIGQWGIWLGIGLAMSSALTAFI